MIPELTFEKPSTYTIAIIVLGLVTGVLIFLFWRAGGFRELKKIWRDTLLNKVTGDYSLKRIGAAVCLFNASVITYCAVLKFNLHPKLEFGIDRSEPMLIVALVLINLAVALGATYQVLLGHLNARKTTDAEGQPLKPPYVEPTKPPVPDLVTAESKPDKG